MLEHWHRLLLELPARGLSLRPSQRRQSRSRPSQKARHQMLFIWRIRSIFPAVPPITHSRSLYLKRMVLVNCPTKIASLLPHISPMHPKAMLSKMGISMMYAAQKARNIGSVVLSLLSRTHTCCASESFVVLSVRLYVIYIQPFCVQTAAEGGQ